MSTWPLGTVPLRLHMSKQHIAKRNAARTLLGFVLNSFVVICHQSTIPKVVDPSAQKYYWRSTRPFFPPPRKKWFKYKTTFIPLLSVNQFLSTKGTSLMFNLAT